MERLTNRFLERVLQLEDYHGGALPASEIRRTGTASFEVLIDSLRPDADSKQLLAVRQDIALDVGVSRARAGIPVGSLMTAIRLDFTILWSALMATAWWLPGPDPRPGGSGPAAADPPAVSRGAVLPGVPAVPPPPPRPE